MNHQDEAKNLMALVQNMTVEWKPLGEVARVLRGKRLTKKELVEGGKYPVFHGGLIPLGWFSQFNRRANQTMVINTGSIGEVVWSDIDFWSSDGTFVVQTPDYIDDKFIFYFLKTREGYLKSQKRVGGVPTIDRLAVENVLTPIPPLRIQQEIVKVLDKFTELEATLEAELQLRKQQYNYYRDFLLNFAGREDVLFKKLSEVTNFQNGKGHEKDISESGKFIVVNSKFISTNGQVLKYSDKQLVPLFEDDILIVMSDLPNGKVLSKTYLVKQNNKFTLNQRIGRITVKNKSELLPKFVSYFLDRTRQLTKYDNKVDQTNLRKEQILEVFIPIPPLSEQARIVAILDKFDTLTTSLSDGLPREIALRRQQYEYYREQLLNFPKSH